MSEECAQITPGGIPEGEEYVEFDHMSVSEQFLHWKLEEKEKNDEYNKRLNQLSGTMNQLCGTMNQLSGTMSEISEIMKQFSQMMTIKNNNNNNNNKIENDKLLKIIINNMEKSHSEMVKQKHQLKQIEMVMKSDYDKINELKKIEKVTHCAKSDTGYTKRSQKGTKICLCCDGMIYKNIQKCSKCKTAIYCDKSCQKKHWLIHRLNCKFNDI